MPPARALWVAPRPPGTAGRAGAPTGLPDVCSQRSGGSPVILWSPPTGGRLVVLPHLQPWTGRAPAGLAWGTCNRIVPAARSGGGLRPLVNRRRRLGQSRVQCDTHRGQPVAGVLSRGWARQPRGLCARDQRAAVGTVVRTGRHFCGNPLPGRLLVSQPRSQYVLLPGVPGGQRVRSLGHAPQRGCETGLAVCAQRPGRGGRSRSAPPSPGGSTVPTSPCTTSRWRCSPMCSPLGG